MTNDRRGADLNRLYELLAQIETRCGGRRTLRECASRLFPQRGVYFFFEPGELREDGATPRVVRVGTHALRPSNSTLWKRLSQHQGHRGGAFAGGGNHRGSIFRRHVGAALATRDGLSDEVRATWGVRSSASREIRAAEYAHEQRVSEFLGATEVLWIEVDDPPSAESDRGVIEANAIALLSNYNKPSVDPPSAAWLGLSSDRDAVRLSGLWNVNHVADSYDPNFLEVMARHLA